MRPLKNWGNGTGLIGESHIGREGINFDTKKQNLGSKNPSFTWERVVGREAEWEQKTAQEKGIWASDPDLLCHLAEVGPSPSTILRRREEVGEGGMSVCHSL